MKKFLNFSTILFSYVLITVLVISCGGSSGNSFAIIIDDATDGADGSDATDVTDGSDATDGAVLPQPEPKDDCLLSDRADKDSFIAILCSEGIVIGKITKISDKAYQSAYFVIPSTESTAGSTTSSTWEIPATGEIQISYSKDYNVTLDAPPVGFVQSFPLENVTMAEADGHTAESPLKILTMSYLMDNQIYKQQLLTGFIYFIPTSTVTTDSNIEVNISVGLAVKSQADFMSMANFTAVSNLGSVFSKLRYVLLNDLDLVAPDGEGAKFDDSIIPVAEKAFDFEGDEHTITLRSEIDTTSADKPAAIIGKVNQGISLFNVTLNINEPISGSGNVGTIVGYTEAGANINIIGSKVNINKNITVYKSAENEDGYVGGLVGSGPVYISEVVVKTGNGAVIQAVVPNDTAQTFSSAVGGLVGNVMSRSSVVFSNNIAGGNVVDVTLGAETSGDVLAGNSVSLGGLTGVSSGLYSIYDNLVKLAISRGKLPADFSFDNVAGLEAQIQDSRVFKNNLVYADFSNLGKVNFLGGLLGKIRGSISDISNNMIFIADSFTVSDVQTSFGAAIALYDPTSDTVLNIDNNFFSSPFTDNDYNNAKLASFVHTANKDINFNNLILDNTVSTVMFKAGDAVANLQGKVGGTNGRPLFTLAEAKTTAIDTLFTVDDSYGSDRMIRWEAFSGGYPQLKYQVQDYSDVFLTKAEIEAAWNETNADIQTKVAARANK